mmetsp:Transcript_30014/g.36452  ORF Transcript_30014/g.36452 Transcript_30014/m.36452 type:complete len:266 (-) Transcript_30014:827-1624(-)
MNARSTRLCMEVHCGGVNAAFWLRARDKCVSIRPMAINPAQSKAVDIWIVGSEPIVPSLNTNLLELEAVLHTHEAVEHVREPSNNIPHVRECEEVAVAVTKVSNKVGTLSHVVSWGRRIHRPKQNSDILNVHGVQAHLVVLCTVHVEQDWMRVECGGQFCGSGQEHELHQWHCVPEVTECGGNHGVVDHVRIRNELHRRHQRLHRVQIVVSTLNSTVLQAPKNIWASCSKACVFRITSLSLIDCCECVEVGGSRATDCSVLILES